MKPVVKAVYFLSILCLSVSTLILAITSFNLPTHVRLFRVTTGSMSPVIKPGSLILVYQLNPIYLETNDVISYHQASSQVPVTHRLIKMASWQNQTVFYTKGDANPIMDLDPVYPNQIEGKVILALPLFGYLSVWARHPLGFLFLIILPSAFIISRQLVN